jgi:hypothetical protein
MRDPNVTSIEVGAGTYVYHGKPVKIGEVKLSLRYRLRFLLTGKTTLSSLPGGGFRVDIHTPQLKQIPLFLIDKLTKGRER